MAFTFPHGIPVLPNPRDCRGPGGMSGGTHPPFTSRSRILQRSWKATRIITAVVCFPGLKTTRSGVAMCTLMREKPGDRLWSPLHHVCRFGASLLFTAFHSL